MSKSHYGNESITQLKGADRVRKRPGVLFGSDGIEGCEHSIFEIIANSIDEARDGFGDTVIVTYYEDFSVEVQDFGRGIPLDYNEKEKRYNWELLFCELYAGGKYKTIDDGRYEYSLGLNGLGLCATQYASEYMQAEVRRGGFQYNLEFKKGEVVGKMKKTEYKKKDTGTRIKWLPDLEVFSDIEVPLEYFQDTLKRQAIVNDGIKFILKYQVDGKFENYEYFYKNGIRDYLNEVASQKSISDLLIWEAERVGRDRKDQKDYKVKMKIALAFSNKVKLKEYYHNSSWLENGGAPERATRSALVRQIDAYLRENDKYLKNDGKITFQDVEESLVLIISSSSTRTS